MKSSALSASEIRIQEDSDTSQHAARSSQEELPLLGSQIVAFVQTIKQFLNLKEEKSPEEMTNQISQLYATATSLYQRFKNEQKSLTVPSHISLFYWAYLKTHLLYTERVVVSEQEKWECLAPIPTIVNDSIDEGDVQKLHLRLAELSLVVGMVPSAETPLQQCLDYFHQLQAGIRSFSKVSKDEKQRLAPLFIQRYNELISLRKLPHEYQDHKLAESLLKASIKTHMVQVFILLSNHIEMSPDKAVEHMQAMLSMLGSKVTPGAAENLLDFYAEKLQLQLAAEPSCAFDALCNTYIAQLKLVSQLEQIKWEKLAAIYKDCLASGAILFKHYQAIKETLTEDQRKLFSNAYHFSVNRGTCHIREVLPAKVQRVKDIIQAVETGGLEKNPGYLAISYRHLQEYAFYPNKVVAVDDFIQEVRGLGRKIRECLPMPADPHAALAIRTDERWDVETYYASYLQELKAALCREQYNYVIDGIKKIRDEMPITIPVFEAWFDSHLAQAYLYSGLSKSGRYEEREFQERLNIVLPLLWDVYCHGMIGASDPDTHFFLYRSTVLQDVMGNIYSEVNIIGKIALELLSKHVKNPIRGTSREVLVDSLMQITQLQGLLFGYYSWTETHSIKRFLGGEGSMGSMERVEIPVLWNEYLDLFKRCEFYFQKLNHEHVIYQEALTNRATDDERALKLREDMQADAYKELLIALENADKQKTPSLARNHNTSHSKKFKRKKPSKRHKHANQNHARSASSSNGLAPRSDQVNDNIMVIAPKTPMRIRVEEAEKWIGMQTHEKAVQAYWGFHSILNDYQRAGVESEDACENQIRALLGIADCHGFSARRLINQRNVYSVDDAIGEYQQGIDALQAVSEWLPGLTHIQQVMILDAASLMLDRYWAELESCSKFKQTELANLQSSRRNAIRNMGIKAYNQQNYEKGLPEYESQYGPVAKKPTIEVVRKVQTIGEQQRQKEKFMSHTDIEALIRELGLFAWKHNTNVKNVESNYRSLCKQQTAHIKSMQESVAEVRTTLFGKSQTRVIPQSVVENSVGISR
ncbi:MAG: hypothetical protein IPP74_11655 [Alphaproteobacteria bacterium]|nr:hypothetical protein [Alphaproteobacteria bacterium]